jgi:hypothetical protein
MGCADAAAGHSLGFQDPASERVRQGPRATPKRRESLLFRVTALAFVLGWLPTVVANARVDYSSWRSWRGLAIVTVMLMLFAAIWTFLVEFQLRFGGPVLAQLRGWNRAPFAAWTSDDHHNVEESSHFHSRCPSPLDPSRTMPTAETRTYALWAAVRADQCSLRAQVMVLVGSVVAGTGLPIYVADRRHDPKAVWLCAAGVLIAGIGAQVSLTTVRIWKSRAAAYRAHAGMPETDPS